MSCTIEDCVKNGLLEQVSVSVPSDEVFIIGDERTQQEGGQGMTFGNLRWQQCVRREGNGG